jgi:cytoskeleton protein RodZ
VNDQVDSPLPESAEEAPKAAQLGLLLRKAREARGLTIADVVAALKYSPRQIEALEADQMTLLPGNVFLRGIVRSYARFLKLDPVPLVALLETETPEVAPDVRPPEDMGVAMPGARRQIPVVVAVAILAAAAVVAGGVWHFLAPVPPATSSSAPASNTQSVVDLAAPQPVPVASRAPEAGGQSGEAVPPAAGVTAPSSVVQSIAPAPAVPIPQPSMDSESRPADSATKPAAIPGGKEIVFEFHGTSWVEVKDASQRIVFTGQYANGNRATASGRPPFQIVIGNAPQVAMKFDGRSVDLVPYTRAEVARLTLE